MQKPLILKIRTYPPFCNLFMWGKSFEGFQLSGKIISHQECLHMLFELGMGLIVVFFELQEVHFCASSLTPP